MQTRTRAPEEAPARWRPDSDAVAPARVAQDVRRRRAAAPRRSPRCAASRLRARARRDRRRRRPERLRQDDAARARLRADRARRRHASTPRPPRSWPSATCCCRGRSAVDNAALALRVAGVERGAGARARGRAAARLRPRRLRARAPARAVGRDAPARRVRAHAARRPPVLCLDEPFAALDALTRQEMQDWLAGALRAEPRTVVLVTHDVEEAIVLADRVVVLSPRPGRVVATLDVDVARPRRRTDPDARRAARARAARSCAHEAAARAARAARRLGGLRAPGGIDELAAARAERDRRRARTTTARCCGATSPSPRARSASASLVALVLGLAVRGRDPLLRGRCAARCTRCSSARRRSRSCSSRRCSSSGSASTSAPKLAIVALVCFFPIVVPTLDALDRVDADLRKLMRTFGASRWQTFRLVEAPAALPGLLTGAKLSVAFAGDRRDPRRAGGLRERARPPHAARRSRSSRPRARSPPC